MVKQVLDLLIYFPDLEEDEIPDRTFMWTILCTLKEEACKTLIKLSQREKKQKV